MKKIKKISVKESELNFLTVLRGNNDPQRNEFHESAVLDRILVILSCAIIICRAAQQASRGKGFNYVGALEIHRVFHCKY